jgi:hypothetical protein
MIHWECVLVPFVIERPGECCDPTPSRVRGTSSKDASRLGISNSDESGTFGVLMWHSTKATYEKIAPSGRVFACEVISSGTVALFPIAFSGLVRCYESERVFRSPHSEQDAAIKLISPICCTVTPPTFPLGPSALSEFKSFQR